MSDWKRVTLEPRVKPAVILAVVLSAAYFGSQSSAELVIRLVLVVGGLGTLLILTHRPEWGLLGLIPVSLLVRWEIGTGTNVALNLTILLLAGLFALWVVRMFVIEKEVRLKPLPVNAPALAFILVTTASLIAGRLPWIPQASGQASLPAQIGGWLLYTFPMGLLLMAGNQLRDLRWLRAVTWVFLAMGVVVVSGYLLPQGYKILAYLARGVEGSVFWIWLAALAFGQAVFNRDLSLKLRAFLVLLVAAMLYVRWVGGYKEWVSGWLPPLFALLVVLWLRSWRWGLAVSLICGLAGIMYFGLLSAQVWTETQQYSASIRGATLPIMLELIKANPILGLGPANYYHYTPLYPLWGWYVKFNSHNNYVDIIAQTGLLGIGIFFWLVVAIGRVGWKLHLRLQDGFSQGYASAALGGLAGMLVSGFMGDWFLPFLYNISFSGFRASAFGWLFLGGLSALAVLHNQDKHRD